MNCSPNKVDNWCESRLYHLYNAIFCFKKRDWCPYSSLKKKIFDGQILFADEIFSLFPINPLSELVQNLENISISREFHKNNKNSEGEIKTHLVDLQISLEKISISGSLYYKEYIVKLVRCFLVAITVCWVSYCIISLEIRSPYQSGNIG